MWRLKNKAFTLIEVMLAVAILSIGLVLVVRSYVTSLRAIKASQNFLIANLLLEEKIWEKQEEGMRRRGEATFEEEEGKFDPPFEGYSYNIKFEPQDFPPQYQGALYKTLFTVSWQERGRGQSSSSVTFLRSKKEE